MSADAIMLSDNRSILEVPPTPSSYVTGLAAQGVSSAHSMTPNDILATVERMSAGGLSARLRELHLTAGLEPMTAFTDMLLATWTAFLAGILFARAGGRRSVRLWACAFLATAVSSLAGAAFHGFRIFFTPLVPLTVLTWKVVPIATATAALCLGAAAAIAWLQPPAQRIAIGILLLEFTVCVAFSIPPANNSFALAGLSYLLVMLAIVVVCARRWEDRSARRIAAGIAISFAALGIQMSALRLGPFDHNDLFHFIQMAAMYALYRGGESLR